MFKSKGLQIPTSRGILTATYNKDEDYPGIEIKLSGELVTLVEHFQDQGIRTVLWKENQDELYDIINYEEDIDE